MSLYLRIFIIALTCMFSVIARANDTAPCVHEDIIGTWDMTKINSNYAYDKNNLWFFPYQRMIFDRDASLRHYTSNKDSGDAQKQMIMSLMPKVQTYSFGEGGQLRTKNWSINDETAYLCLIFTKDVGPDLKGDILLAAGRKNGAMVVKAFRKIATQ